MPDQNNAHDPMLKAPGYSPPTEFDIPAMDDNPIMDEQSLIRKFSDGSVVVGPEMEEPQSGPQIPMDHHEANLAEYLNPSELSDISHCLTQMIDTDIDSQAQFFQANADTIKYLGLDLTADSGGDDLAFKGASSVYSSAMFESALDIVTSAKMNIFPSSNMVDTVILGESAPELQDIAYRKKAWFNYYFDDIAKEFRKEAMRAMFWTVLSGSVYKKVYICPVLGRVVSNFIPIEDFIVNRSYSSHLASSRKTHILRINEREFQIRVMSGMYRDIEVTKDDSDNGDDSNIKHQLNQISGYDGGSRLPEDAGYTIYECHVDYRIKSDPMAQQYNVALPYIVSIDKESGIVLSIRRNWDFNDSLKKKKEYFVNYSLLPSLDGEGYGLTNYAGRLAEAATSMTRQLITAGELSNFPGGVYQSGMRLENNNIRPGPGEFIPLATGGTPINQAVMPLPYKEPSSALLSLKNDIEDCIRKPSAIITQKINDIPANASQGVYMMMLESLHKLPNALMQGFHESFGMELELFNDRFADWMEDNRPYPFLVPGGQHVIMKSDFQSNVKVKPSSDPSQDNTSKDIMLSEMILNNAKESPNIHNVEYAYRYAYKKLGVPEDVVNGLLSPPANKTPPPQPMDPVSTMMAIIQGQPVAAAPWQDHDAYISILDSWMQTNPQNPSLPAAQALKTQHEALRYMVNTYAQLGVQPPQDPSQVPPEQQNQMAIAVAQIKQQEAQQAAQAAGTPPEPPLDPAKVQLEDVRATAESAREKHAIEKMRLELESMRADREFALKEREFELDVQIQSMKLSIEEQKANANLFKTTHDQEMKEQNHLSKEQEKLLNNTENDVQLEDIS